MKKLLLIAMLFSVNLVTASPVSLEYLHNLNYTNENTITKPIPRKIQLTLWSSNGSDNPLQYKNYHSDGVYSSSDETIQPEYQLLYSKIINSGLSVFTEKYSNDDVTKPVLLTIDQRKNPLNKYKLYGAIDVGNGSHYTKKFYLSWNKNNDDRTINIWEDIPVDDSSMEGETIYDPYEVRMKVAIGVALRLSADHNKTNTQIDGCLTNYNHRDIPIYRLFSWYDPSTQVFHTKNYDPQVKNAINEIVGNCK